MWARRGQKGDTGATGAAGLPAVVLYDNGDPNTLLLNPGQAYGLYYNQAANGTVWTWDPGGPWVDTLIPITGPAGADGADGVNAFTTTTASFITPVDDGTGVVIITVADTSWMVPGQVLYIQGAGYYRCFGVTTPTTFVALNLEDAADGEYASNTPPGTLINSGAQIGPGGLQGPSGPPMQVLSGAGNPASDPPLTNVAALYIDTNPAGHLWTWSGITGGPWVDTGVQVQGNTGATGADGHTPVLTMTTAPPVGGANGDWHIQQVNGGRWQVYYRSGGFWSAFVNGTITANRLIGYSTTNPTPNPLGLPANSGDQWWTQIGAVVTMYVYDGTSWNVAVTFPVGGGGGSQTFEQTLGFSPGQMSGALYALFMQTSIQYVPKDQSTVSTGATVTMDTFYQWNRLNVGHDTRINYTTPAASRDTDWKFELTNTTAAERTISYSADRWMFNEGITYPTVLSPAGDAGDKVSLICRYERGYMVIITVIQNTTVIPG